jgi:hypothetical protein
MTDSIVKKSNGSSFLKNSAGVIKEVAEDDVLDVRSLRPIIGEIVDDLRIRGKPLSAIRTVMAIAAISLHTLAIMQLHVRGPVLVSILRPLGRQPVLAKDGLSMLTQLSAVAGDLVGQAFDGGLSMCAWSFAETQM